MKSESSGKLNTRRITALWLGLFAAALAFCLWKLPYGFGGSDEGFYLTVAHRLILGDSLFADEWHLSQLSSFFLYPFVKSYRAVNGSNEGIMLTARYAYLVMHAAVSAFIYLRLRKFGLAAALASVLYLVYTPFDMMCLSYNTIALDMLAVTGLLLGTAGEGDNFSFFVGGVSFACAMVCCPYLAVAYALYGLATAAFALPGLKKYSGCGIFTGKRFLYFSLGVFIPFVLFMVFFLRHTEPDRLLAALPGLLSDPEHPSYSLWFMAKHYLYCILTAHRLMGAVLGLYAVHLALLLMDKKRLTRRGLHFCFGLLCSVLCAALFIGEFSQQYPYYNAVVFPPVFAGFTAYLLLKTKPSGLFISTFLLGLIYSICVSSTSNMGFLVISMAFSVVNIASFVFMGLFVRETRGDAGHGALCLSLGCSLAFFAVLLCLSKANHCFWDDAPSRLKSEISAGPGRGIITSEALEESYTLIYEDMQSYREADRGELLIMSQIPWCYLIADDYPYGSFSAWLSGLDESTVQRLELYYQINPDKIPDYIYIVKSNAFGPLFLQHEDIVAGAESHGYTLLESAVSYKLHKAH